MRLFFRAVGLVVGVAIVATLAFVIGLLWGASGNDVDDVEATDVEATDVEATDVEATDVEATDVGAVESLTEDPVEPAVTVPAEVTEPEVTVPAVVTEPAVTEPPAVAEPAVTEGVLGGSRFFEVSVPQGWEIAFADQELSYGWRSQYLGPDGDRVRVEVSNTQPPATAMESADAIAAAVGERLISGPQLLELGSFEGEVYRIEFRGQSGDLRSDYFFADGGRGYAVLAIASDGDLGDADIAAQSLIGSLRTTG